METISIVTSRWTPDHLYAFARNGFHDMKGLERIRIGAGSPLDFAENALNFGSWSWDSDSNTLHWSRGMFQLLGIDPYDRAPDFGHFAKIIHPVDAAGFNDVANLPASGWLDERRFRIIRPEGELRWLHNRTEARHRADGSISMVSGIVVDVTSQHKVTRTQIEGHALFAAVRALIGGIVWQTAADGSVIDDLGWWQSSNVPEPGRGWSRLDKVHPEDLESVKSAWAKALENRSIYRVAFRIMNNAGVYMPVVSSAAPVENDDGTLRGWICLTMPQSPATPGASPLAGAAIPGPAIRAARAYLGWSGSVLAEQAGLSFSTIRRIEAGKADSVGAKYVQRAIDTLLAEGIRFSADAEGSPQITFQLPPAPNGARANPASEGATRRPPQAPRPRTD